MNMQIAVLTAMDAEYTAVCGALGGDEGSIGAHEVRVLRCGIGKVNAAALSTEIILSSRPDCMISTGCAGGLREDVHLMEVVAASQTCYHDVWCGEPNAPGQVQGMPLRFDADKRLLSRAQALPGVRAGLVCTGDCFCTEASDIQSIASAFPDALAVDMESASIAQVCHIYGVPFLSLRVISDSVASGDRASEYSDFWSEVSGRSFGALRRLLETL